MKRLITALSVLTLGTTVGNLSSSWNINQKVETANTLISGNILNNYQFNNHVIKSNFKNFKSKDWNGNLF